MSEPFVTIAVVVGIVLYLIAVVYIFRFSLIGVVKLYRWVRPASPVSREIELNLGAGYKPTPEKGQPFFGPNALPWAIQFVIGLLLLIFVVPWIKEIIDPYVRYIVENGLCQPTGWCSAVVVGRTRATTPL